MKAILIPLFLVCAALVAAKAMAPTKNCPPFAIGQEVTGSCVRSSIGTTCHLTCRAPYYATTGDGKFKLTCVDDPYEAEGYWAGSFPSCKRSKMCSNVAVRAGSRLSGKCVNATEGQKCRLTCANGTTLIGGNVTTCLHNGTWTNHLGVCKHKAKECPILDDANSLGVEGGLKGSCPSKSIGAKCLVTACLGPYHPTTGNGQLNLTCTDDPNKTEGYWSGRIPSCEPNICSPIINRTGGQLNGNCVNATEGQQCLLNCTSVNTLMGSNLVTCRTDGTWSTLLGECKPKECPALEVDSSQGVKGSCVTSPIASSCFFTCRDPYYPTTGDGKMTLTCVDDPENLMGYWSGSIPNCRLTTT